MIQLYGSANGFGWNLGETIGAQVGSVPTSLPLQKGYNSFLVFMGALVVVFLVIILMLNVLLHYVVITPVVKISEIASQVSMGQMDVPAFERTGKDEIASLSATSNGIRRGLENAMLMLDT